MKDELHNYMDRPKQYQNIDGTIEMGMGVMMLSFGLVSYLTAFLPEGALWRKNGIATFEFIPVVMIPIMLFQYWGVKAIKKHITWPRTGYVAFRRSGRAIIASLVASAVLGAGVAFLIAFARRDHSMNLARAGYLAGLWTMYPLCIIRWSREHTWKWLIATFMAMGVLVIAFLVPGDIRVTFPPVAAFVGLVWLGSGVATLYWYIRHTQPPVPTAE